MNHYLRSAFDTRQTMRSKDFEIFYYSDLHFQSVGLHAHDYYEFYFFLEGQVRMEIAGRHSEPSRGDMIVIPPGTEHRAVITDGNTPYRRFVFWISRQCFEQLTARSEDFAYLIRRIDKTGRSLYHFDAPTFHVLCGKLFALLDELHAGRFGRETRIGLCMEDLLLQINRAVYESESHGSRGDAPSRYEVITAYILDHLGEELTLDRLSREFFISKYYIAHLFQETTGQSVHQFILSHRLAAASAAIRSGTKASEAAASSGFSDYSSFYRAFRQEFGMAPAQYRAQQKPPAEDQRSIL
ncbi:MAG: helix-turn-helix domain-containing protein [Lachnospiraceae bacterium]|nr:helix-turn-helix domain-containing protein [Lachnospiraceae bacterium]